MYQILARIDDTLVFYPGHHHGVICGDAIDMGPAPGLTDTPHTCAIAGAVRVFLSLAL
ncbi:hypothetical protein [Klebsiella oxytoca]|uniref:hypothetical protein n=1 Tax=Klebsiella oxytoca TaxID=571 RepID=UPI0034D26C4B